MVIKDILYFENYKIAEDGTLFDKEGKVCGTYINASGYRVARVTPTNGKSRLMRIHRLVALAFLEYRKDWKSVPVNHLDGDKLNTHSTNLEWSTLKLNNIHAYTNDLNPNGIKLVCYNIENNMRYDFSNLKKASTVVGYSHNDLNRLVKTSVISPCGKWVWKSPSDTRTLEEILRCKTIIVKPERYKSSDEIIGYNCKTNTLHVFETVNQAKKTIGCNKETILIRISCDNFSPYKDWVITSIQNIDSFPKYTDKELLILNSISGNGKLYSIENIVTGKLLLCPSLYTFCRYLSMDVKNASNIRSAIAVNSKYKDYQITEVLVEVKSCELREALKKYVCYSVIGNDGRECS